MADIVLRRIVTQRHGHNPRMRWEIFCQVIDNHGDLGVCLRLARDLATRGEAVRLWVDDASALEWMAPDLVPSALPPAPSGAPALPLDIRPWGDATREAVLAGLQGAPADVLVEAFGCNPPAPFIEAWCAGCERHQHPGIWINLEYLSAEDFVERNHGLMSPVAPSGPVRKYFFYPGFTGHTGGLLREPDLIDAQASWDRAALRARWGGAGDESLVSLFCYEPAALQPLLRGLAQGPQPVRLLVTPGRAAAAVQAATRTLDAQQPGWNARHRLHTVHVPWLPQREYDQLLWACDFNFVRGEDSLVRALWAGRPFAWQLYEQQDAAHHDKLEAFLRWADQPTGTAPADWLALMRRWNGAAGTHPAPLRLDAHCWTAWQGFTLGLRQRLLAQTGLTTALCEFVAKKR